MITYRERLRALESVKKHLIDDWKNEVDNRHRIARQIMNVNMLISRARNYDLNILRHIY